jgi:lipopolysaccharide transport system ATP-binding protein
MTPLIDVHNIGKMYSIPNPSTRIKEPYWSLKGITFQVEKGQSIAIIGENGAGKSTLLKIIANIVTPTEGQVIVRGNIAVMLELGAGFHHELTGRENAYVFGALMGIKRKEIKDKFDDIVAFAEVGGFIDSKVRSYSSGMILRLAFSVASYLRPDIILFDELLAVADSKFRKKCIERIQVLKSEGTAIILVQHNDESIRTICDDAILLEKGIIKAQGKIEDIYL